MLSVSNYTTVSTQELEMQHVVTEYFNELDFAAYIRNVNEVSMLLTPIIHMIGDEDSVLACKLANMISVIDSERHSTEYIRERFEDIRKYHKNEFEAIIYNIRKNRKNVIGAESKKDSESVMEIQLPESMLSSGRYEIEVYVDGHEFILFTAHKDVIEDAVIGRLTNEGIDRVDQDARLYRDMTEALVDTKDIVEFLNMVNTFKGKKVIVR